MLKPYAAKLENIKSEISKIGVDVVDAMELSLRALEDKKIDGKIIIDKKNIYDKDVDEVSVRKRVVLVYA